MGWLPQRVPYPHCDVFLLPKEDLEEMDPSPCG